MVQQATVLFSSHFQRCSALPVQFLAGLWGQTQLLNQEAEERQAVWSDDSQLSSHCRCHWGRRQQMFVLFQSLIKFPRKSETLTKKTCTWEIMHGREKLYKKKGHGTACQQDIKAHLCNSPTSKKRNKYPCVGDKLIKSSAHDDMSSMETPSAFPVSGPHVPTKYLKYFE